MNRSAQKTVAHITVGAVKVTSMLDGNSAITDEHFPTAGKDRIAELRAAAGFEPGPMPLPFNAFHFEIGGRQVMIDVGNNRTINPLTGRMVDVLPEAGIDPLAIDAILVTHVHIDHVAGLLTPDGNKIFPNAEIIVPRVEVEFWGDESKLGTAPPEVERVVKNVAPALRTYRDQLRPFDGTPEVIPGVEAVALYGHTPAQTGYMLTSGAEHLFFWGDTVHLSAFQLPETGWSIRYDVDPEAAVATRRRVLEMVATEKLRVAGAHLPSNGIGFIERNGDGYRFDTAL